MSEEIVIVGAGPAGLACAKELTERGIEPVVFEKGDFGDKVCGDLVGESWTRYPISPWLSEEAVEKRFDKFIIDFHGNKIIKEVKRCTLDRTKFEKALYQEAREGGAEFRFEKVKDIEKEGRKYKINNELEADFLVGADGVNSLVRRFFGEEINKALAIRGYSDMNLERPKIIVDNDMMIGGYAWSFPKKDKANIGLGGRNIEKVEEAWDKFSKERKLEDVRGGFVPCGLPCKTEFENAILVGDAASQVEPFILGGINLALICGKLAGVAISKNKSYEDLWKLILLNRFRKMKLKSNLFWNFLSRFESSKYLIKKFF